MRGRYLKEEVIAEGGEAGVGLVGERGLDGGEIHRRRRRWISPTTVGEEWPEGFLGVPKPYRRFMSRAGPINFMLRVFEQARRKKFVKLIFNIKLQYIV